LKTPILKNLNEKNINRSKRAAFVGGHCHGAKRCAKPRAIRYSSAGNGDS